MNQPLRTMRPPEGGTSNWPHRAAVLLACATFPLIWVGGLVTTTEAGMAVRDWPTTNGYNLFFLPLSQWFGSGWKFFIEHSHRVLGGMTGILTILLVLVTAAADNRRWLKYTAIGALGAVIFQGVLGGVRVLENERLLAMAHACTGPLFFTLTVLLAVFTSARWQDAGAEVMPPDGESRIPRDGIRRVEILAGITAALAYVQLVLGAQIRHIPPTASPAWFDAAVWFHLLNAALVLAHGMWLAWRTRGHCRWLRTPAWSVAGLLVLQVALGAATWVVNFGWPQWAQRLALGEDYIIQAQSVAQAVVTTAHVATGALILAVSALVVARAARLHAAGRALAVRPCTLVGRAAA